MIRKIDHIGIAAEDSDALRPIYEALLGLRLDSKDRVASQKVDVSFYPCANVRFELLQPSSPESTVARFLASRGPGLHHVAFEVDDIEKELARAKALGMRLIDETPRPGAHNTRVAFLHPKSTGGVLFEYVQHPAGHG